MTNRLVVWSYGGGVQSATIGVLIKRGKLPTPDVVVMADTWREGTATWEYLDNVMRPYLKGAHLVVEIASHHLALHDLYYDDSLLLPAYTEHGKLSTFCSGEWKRDVVGRWLREQGVTKCDEWIGFSYEEIRRVSDDRVAWRRHVYPLIDAMLTRADCLQIVRDEGLPQPPKSACWCCPHRNNLEWMFLRDKYPHDWQQAIELDRHIRKCDPGLWLHRDRVPLDQADISLVTRLDVGQCGLGYCFL